MLKRTALARLVLAVLLSDLVEGDLGLLELGEGLKHLALLLAEDVAHLDLRRGLQLATFRGATVIAWGRREVSTRVGGRQRGTYRPMRPQPSWVASRDLVKNGGKRLGEW